jgi:Cys-tRNA(Pro) deacylase
MSSTPAIEAVVAAGIAHRVVRTAPAGTIEEAAQLRGLPVEALLKSLVVRRGEGDYLFVLVPGGRALDWAKLRAHLRERRMTLPDAAEALAATGYPRGAITPFGATTAWPVVVDASVIDAGEVSIGGGAHGVSITLAPGALIAALDATVADVTKPA